MANKPIIDVEVNDEQFKKFLELYDGFHGKLAEAPEDWAKVDKASHAAFNAIASAMLAQNALLAKSLKGQEDFTHETDRAVSSWEKLGRHTKSAAGNIVGATKAMVKWIEVSTVVSGLLGVGSLFGIDRLGLAVTAGRRSAAGLGVSYGQQQSFGLNFGRFVDPGAVLGSVSTGLFDVTSPEYLALLRAGISPQMMAKGNAADVGAELLAKIPRTFGNVPANQRGMLANVLGYGQLGIGTEEINRYLGASPAERAKQQAAYREDAGGLGLSKGQQGAWNDFTTQLSRAGKMIENTFVVGLTPLLPGLEKLSKGFSDAIAAFLGSGTVKHWIDVLGDGLKWLGDYFASPKFKTDAEDFAKALGELAVAVVRTMTWISTFTREFINPSGPVGMDAAISNAHKYGSGAAMGPGDAKDDQRAGVWRLPFGAYLDPKDVGLVPPTIKPVPPSLLHNESFSGDASGLLNRIRYAETGNNPNQTSPRGAQGPYQFMPGTWADYGAGGDPFNPQDSRAAAGRFMSHLLAKFAGNLREATAAYNWGEGNVDKDLKQHGADWEQYLPAETKQYLAKVLGGNAPSAREQAPDPRPSITVHNNTGGSAILSASQIAI